MTPNDRPCVSLPEVSATIDSGIAHPLPPALRREMESLFGADLGALRIRHDAASLASHGLRAVACGHRIALAPGENDFGSKSGRFLLAHEITHCLQQSAGMAAGGARLLDDPGLEAEADRIGALAANQCGDVFVPFRGRGVVRRAGRVAQPKINVLGFTGQKSSEYATFAEIERHLKDPNNAGAKFIAAAGLTETQKKELWEVLHIWAGRPRHPKRPRKSIDLEFSGWQALAQALVGHVRSKTNKMYEAALAKEVLESAYIRTKLKACVMRLWNYAQQLKKSTDPAAKATLTALKSTSGRYGMYYGRKWVLTKLGQKSVYDALHDFVGDDIPVRKVAPLLADFAYVQRRLGQLDHKGLLDANTPHGKYFNEGRGATYWGIDEDSNWAQDARGANEPVGAGPSATTVMTLGSLEWLKTNGHVPGDSHDLVQEAVAWALFAFWNAVEQETLWAWKAGIHTFHEVMYVAQKYNVPYQLHKYPNGVPPDIEDWYN